MFFGRYKRRSILVINEGGSINHMKYLVVIMVVVTFIQCNNIPKHKTSEEILASGKIDTNEFNLIRYDSVVSVRYYKYKYDTALSLEIHYIYSNYTKTIEEYGYALYYKGKPEGKWLLFDRNGTLTANANYHNGRENGDFILYEDGRIKNSVFYKNGEPIYEIEYDSTGKTIDTIMAHH